MPWNTLVLAALLVGVGILAAVPLTLEARRLSECAPWALPILICMTFMIIDVRGHITNGGAIRYLGPVLAIICIVAYRIPKDPYAKLAHRLAICLFLYTVIGTAIGRFELGTTSGPLPIAIGLAALCLGCVRAPMRPLDIAVGLRALAWMSLVFSILVLAQRRGLLPGAEAVFNHERAFITFLGIACSFAVRSPILILSSCVTATLAFLAYPAATLPIVGVAGLATYAIALRPPGRKMRIGYAAAACALLAWAVLNIDTLVIKSAAYFQTVGKADNGAVRERLYTQALAEIHDRPWFSHGFTGDLSLLTKLAGVQDVSVPIHNDYLTVAVGGGIVAAIVLLALIASVNVYAMGAIHASAGSHKAAASAIVCLLGAFNGAALSALANPIFINPQTGVTAWSIGLACLSLARALTLHLDAYPAAHASPATARS